MSQKSWKCDACNQESVALIDWPVGSEGWPKSQLCQECFERMMECEKEGIDEMVQTSR
jgi:hypothetical protein